MGKNKLQGLEKTQLRTVFEETSEVLVISLVLQKFAMKTITRNAQFYQLYNS